VKISTPLTLKLERVEFERQSVEDRAASEDILIVFVSCINPKCQP
jgi:hypothetical protein